MQLWRSIAILFLGLLLAACNSIEHRSEAIPKQALPKVTTLNAQPTVVWSSNHGAGDLKNEGKLRLAVTREAIISADGKGHIFAQDRNSGALKWQVDTKATLSAGPAVIQETILVGTRDGHLKAYRAHDGQFLWQTQLNGEVLASPKGYNGMIYVKTQEGTITALQLADGKIAWRYSLHMPPIVLRQSSSPIITPAHVLVGFPNGRLVALHRQNGMVDWERDISVPKGRSDIQRMSDISADPVVINNTAYVVSYQGRLVALSEQDGQSVWEQDMSSYSGLDILGRELFVADAKGEVWAMDRTSGKVMWKQSSLQGRRLSKPVAFGNTVVIGDEDGFLHLLSQTDGSYINRISIDKKGVEAPPVLMDNKLYVLSRGGKIAVLSLGGQ